jgi:hypothetical protein
MNDHVWLNCIIEKISQKKIVKRRFFCSIFSNFFFEGLQHRKRIKIVYFTRYVKWHKVTDIFFVVGSGVGVIYYIVHQFMPIELGGWCKFTMDCWSRVFWLFLNHFLNNFFHEHNVLLVLMLIFVIHYTFQGFSSNSEHFPRIFIQFWTLCKDFHQILDTLQGFSSNSGHFAEIFIKFWTLCKDSHQILNTLQWFSSNSEHFAMIFIKFWTLCNDFHQILNTLQGFSSNSEHFARIFIKFWILCNDFHQILDTLQGFSSNSEHFARILIKFWSFKTSKIPSIPRKLL